MPLFCKLLPPPVTCISQDVLRWDFHLIGRTVAEVSDDEHIFANQNTKLLYEQYLKQGGYTIVVEGLFTWDDAESSQGSAKEFADLAERYGYTVKCIVLKAAKEELLARNAARTYSVPADEFETLYANIYKTIAPKEIVIDSTGQTPKQTVLAIRDAAGLT